MPNFDLPDLGYQPAVLAAKELLHFNSLKVSLDQALEYKRMTRDQSMCQDWHRLRLIFSENRESEDSHEKSIFLLFRQNIPLNEHIQDKTV